MRTYEVQLLSEASKLGYPMGIYEGYSEAEFKWHDPWGLWELEDGKPIRLIGTDGGEPEDQLLVRDWRWVQEELQKAYNEGFVAGYKCSCDERL